jgi:hypothetical protein
MHAERTLPNSFSIWFDSDVDVDVEEQSEVVYGTISKAVYRLRHVVMMLPYSRWIGR